MVVRYQRHGCADLDDELPYVLDVLARAGAERVIAVGASVGGMMARRLATVVSVAGVVLVDSASEDFRVEGPLPHDVRAALRAEVVDNEEGIDLRSTHSRLREDRLRGTLAGVPLVVVARGEGRWPVPSDVAVQLDAAWRAAQEGLRDLSERAVLVVAARSGHHVAQDRPDLVAAAVRHLAAPGSVTTEQLARVASAG